MPGFSARNSPGVLWDLAWRFLHEAEKRFWMPEGVRTKDDGTLKRAAPRSVALLRSLVATLLLPLKRYSG